MCIRDRGSISFIEEEVVDKYIAAVSSESLSNVELNENVSIVYTPLNGAGRYCVTRVLRENGYKNIVMCDRQGAIYAGRPGLNWIKEEMAQVKMCIRDRA